METSRVLDCAMLLTGSFATWRPTAVAADDTTGTDNAATVSRPPLAYEVSAYELAPHLRASGDHCWTREEAMSVLAGRVAAERRRRELRVCYYRARQFHAQLGRFCSRDPAGLIDAQNLYLHTHAQPSGFCDPSGLGGIVVIFRPENIAEMGWTRRIGERPRVGKRKALAGTFRKTSVRCWDDPFSIWVSGCCPVTCEIDAEFSIHIWYVAARLDGYQDGPFVPPPPKTIEGIFGHEQLHVVNWRNFLAGLAGEVACAPTPQEMEIAIRNKINEFAEKEEQHQHTPPEDLVLYPPQKGPGTMPEPDGDR